ncbi:hypothetical protein PGB90_005830 [Kerria lacca]
MNEITNESRLNVVDQVTYFKFQKRTNINVYINQQSNENETLLEIEHSEFTDVDAVGLQIWDGALLLANFVIHEGNSLFCDKNILELSSGTGFVSIITAIYCKHVTCTDINEAYILETIEKNFKRNNNLIKATYKIKELNFFKNWTTDIENILNNTEIILASEGNFS